MHGQKFVLVREKGSSPVSRSLLLTAAGFRRLFFHQSDFLFAGFSELDPCQNRLIIVFAKQNFERFIMKRYELDDRDKKLIEIALEVLKENFDDGIYNHTVGCAVLCKNGNIYKGVNCDGIHGSCAEYITMGIAISAGERDFDTIVATHDKHLNYVIPPCGNCRQMLYEYCPDIKVIVNDETGNLIKVKARDLLPLALPL